METTWPQNKNSNSSEFPHETYIKMLKWFDEIQLPNNHEMDKSPIYMESFASDGISRIAYYYSYYY